VRFTDSGFKTEIKFSK